MHGILDSMEHRPTIEEVLGALDTLYRGESPADKEKASSWLIKLHSSVSH